MKNSIKKSITATGIALGLALLGGAGIAAPASAITNPADNPRKIVVKGDDGQTYTDGQDTLPGFDDEACTYIPGAWFDFKNNRVHYADGQSIAWTEWDRASGYQDWLKSGAKSPSSGTTKPGSGSAKPNSPSSGSNGKTTTKSTGTKSSGGSATPSKRHSSGGGTGSQATGSVAGSAGTTAAPADSETGTSDSGSQKKRTSSSHDKKKSADKVSGTPSESPETGDAEETAVSSELAEVASPQDASSTPGPVLGLSILGGLAAIGALVWGGVTLARRRAGADG